MSFEQRKNYRLQKWKKYGLGFQIFSTMIIMLRNHSILIIYHYFYFKHQSLMRSYDIGGFKFAGVIILRTLGK